MTDDSAMMKANTWHGDQSLKENAARMIMSLKETKGKKMNEGQKRADNYLRAIKEDEHRLRELLRRIEFLKYRATGGGAIRYDKDHVQTTPEDILSKSMAEAVDLEHRVEKIREDIEDRWIIFHDIIQKWNGTTTHAYVLMFSYMTPRTVREIAQIIDKSDRQVYRIKLEALELFSKEL